MARALTSSFHLESTGTCSSKSLKKGATTDAATAVLPTLCPGMPVSHQGYLQKQGRIFGLWTRRYFRLIPGTEDCPGVMEYYCDAPCDAEREPQKLSSFRGTIYIAAIKRVVVDSNLEFELHTFRRHYRMRAPNEATKQDWLDALQKAKEQCRNQPPPFLLNSHCTGKRSAQQTNGGLKLRRSVVDGFAAIEAMEEMKVNGESVSSDEVTPPGLEVEQDAPTGDFKALRPGNDCVVIAGSERTEQLLTSRSTVPSAAVLEQSSAEQLTKRNGLALVLESANGCAVEEKAVRTAGLKDLAQMSPAETPVMGF